LSDVVHIPMGEVAARLAELPRDREIVVMCHSGVRSAYVTSFLLQQGLRARNLAGGIEAWAFEVDPAVPTY
jgi:rhodanese-related sulfurtransferase